MPRVDEFVKNWSPRERKSITERIKNVVSPPPPLRYKLAMALYKLKVENNKLDYIIAKMKERDAALFEKVVQAHMEKDVAKASMYAQEVAELRKLTKALMTAKLALERVALRLETIMTMGDVVVNLAPVVSVVKDLKKYLIGIVPEIGLELAEIGDLLESVVVEAGELGEWTTLPNVYSEEAKKILEEAAIIAEQRMKTEFPELPSGVPSAQQQKK
jgi:division protein CdvB (Snf7/Vps24/ESCRT-III family)